MAETSSILSSLYLPVSDHHLLVPNVSVAEIVDYQIPTELDNAPEWFLGHIQWRGLRLPLVAYNLMNGQPLSEQSSNRRLAIINTIGKEHNKLPFFALLTQGIPSQVKVDSEIIQPEEGDLGPADLMWVNVQGNIAVIPNIDYMETQILSITA